MKPIYLDYAATTPLDKRVLDKMLPYLQQDGNFGNSASTTHIYGWQAKHAIDEARKLIAKRLNIKAKEIIFTSGATEANNLAIIGAAQGNKQHGKHIITSLTEHKAVLDTCGYLETLGFKISYLAPESDGLININKLQAAIRPDTILVSIMHVNNETGVIQDIAKIGDVLSNNSADKKIIFHVDAAQSVGKIYLDLSKLSVDLLSISGHKIYGPKGVGGLYVASDLLKNGRLQTQMHGGGHEYGLRSGTLATQQIVGFAYALKYSIECLEEERNRLSELEALLLAGLNDLGGILLNGSKERRRPGLLNLSIDGLHGEALIASLDQIAVSSGSACNSAVSATSHVLKAMGIPDNLAHAALRISMGRFTTRQDIILALDHLKQVINRLRKLMPD